MLLSNLSKFQVKVLPYFAGLEKGYYQHDFDPMLHELSSLPPTFTTEALEELAIDRTSVLEVTAWCL